MDGGRWEAQESVQELDSAVSPLNTIKFDSYGSHADNEEGLKHLKPGMLVVVAVDPLATLQPLFEGDEEVEKAARDMYPRMRRYLGFLRGVQHRERGPEEEGSHLEGGVGLNAVRTSVHLNLVHTERPVRSQYDTIDESMCVPLAFDRPTSPVPVLGVQRHNSLRHPKLSRGASRKPIYIQNATGTLPWKDLYAHTIMDAFAAISELDAALPSDDVGSLKSPEISTSDMQRYDSYQTIDRARESSQYQKAQERGVDAGTIVDEYWDDDNDDEYDYEDEEEYQSQFRLSTVISGLTIEDDASVADQLRTASSYAPSVRIPSPRVASPTSSGLAPSAWRGRSIRITQQPSRSQLDTIKAKDSAIPAHPPSEPLSPKSPTMTGTSGETNETKATDASLSSAAMSTQATTVPDPNSPPHQSEIIESPPPESHSWSFDQLELAGGLGANKPLERQCAIHVRIWLDLTREDVACPEDPRTFFEELKMLRAYVYSHFQKKKTFSNPSVVSNVRPICATSPSKSKQTRRGFLSGASV